MQFSAKCIIFVLVILVIHPKFDHYNECNMD